MIFNNDILNNELFMEYISLGSNCSITYQLEKFGLRKTSYPFDWVKISLGQLILILETDFSNYVETLEYEKISQCHQICTQDLITQSNNLHSLILTNKYKVKFAHELSEKYQLDEFQNKMRQRIDRFRKLPMNICFIRIELKPINQSWYLNIIHLNNLLLKYISDFTLILIICSELEFSFPSNIKLYRFDKFDSDWKMNTIDWEKIFLI